MYHVTKHGKAEANGSFAHCFAYLLLLCQMAGHSGNMAHLMRQGWRIKRQVVERANLQ